MYRLICDVALNHSYSGAREFMCQSSAEGAARVAARGVTGHTVNVTNEAGNIVFACTYPRVTPQLDEVRYHG